MESNSRLIPVLLLIAAMAAAGVNTTAADGADRTERGFASILEEDASSISSYSSDLENFSKTAKFLTTLQISGGAKDGGIEEAEDNPYDNTDNTLESIWVWLRYEALTGDQQFRPNVWRAWNYSEANPSWMENDSGKIYSCGWAVITWTEYLKVIGPNTQYENYAKTAAQFIDTNNGWEPSSGWQPNERETIRGWGAGALYTYAKATGDTAARSAALRIGNSTKAALTADPSLAQVEAWALTGGAMVFGVASSTLQEFPDNAWLQNMVANVDTYVTLSGSGPGRSQNGWEAWNSLAFDAVWKILKDDYSYYHTRNITNNLILRDLEKDGGLPTNIGDPTNTDESWVTNYRAYFGLRPALENAANATLKGIVKDATSGAPIAGAKVTATDNVSALTTAATTDAAGAYTLLVPPQIYNAVASATGYNGSALVRVVLPPGSTKTLDFTLKSGGGGGNDTSPPVITHAAVTTAVEGNAVALAMTVTDNVGVSTVTAYHRTQGAGTWKSGLAQKGTGNDYAFTIPAVDIVLPAVEYYLEAVDTSANRATSPAGGATSPHVITVTPKGGGNDTTPPTIVHTPVTSANEGTAVQIVATVTDNIGVARVDLVYQLQGGNWTTIPAQKQSGDDYAATIPGADVKAPSVEYAVKAADAATNTASSPAGSTPYSIKVIPKPVPPRVVGTNPVDGARGVPADSVIEISFSAQMDPVSTQAAFTISPALSGKFSGFDPVVVFDPDRAFEDGTKYTVTVSAGAKDANGTAMTSAIEFSFMTRDDVLPPCAGCGNYPFYATPLGIGLAVTLVALVALVAIALLVLLRRKRKQASPHPAPPSWQDPSQQPWQQAQQWQYQNSQQDPYSQQPPWNQP